MQVAEIIFRDVAMKSGASSLLVFGLHDLPHQLDLVVEVLLQFRFVDALNLVLRRDADARH